MATRKRLIIQWAEAESEREIEAVPAQLTERKENLKKIFQICQALVDRAAPIYPSAQEVCETGRSKPFGFENFISPQTIYNKYGELLKTWRKAWRQINSLQDEKLPSFEQLLDWDASHLDSSSHYNVQFLQRICLELKHANDGFRQLISENVPVYADNSVKSDESAIDELSEWLESITKYGFKINDFGLIVTKRTPPETIIMEASLWRALVSMSDAAKKDQNLRRSATA